MIKIIKIICYNFLKTTFNTLIHIRNKLQIMKIAKYQIISLHVFPLYASFIRTLLKSKAKINIHTIYRSFT